MLKVLANVPKYVYKQNFAAVHHFPSMKLQTNVFSVHIYSNKSLMRFNFIVIFFIQLLSLQVSILYSLHIGKAFPNGIGEFQKLSEKCRI